MSQFGLTFNDALVSRLGSNLRAFVVSGQWHRLGACHADGTI